MFSTVLLAFGECYRFGDEVLMASGGPSEQQCTGMISERALASSAVLPVVLSMLAVDL